jgi:hypothetical protein
MKVVSFPPVVRAFAIRFLFTWSPSSFCFLMSRGLIFFPNLLPGNGGRPTNTNPEYWKRKVIRPDYEILCGDIKTLGYVGAGKKYGVSDNAVRKWKEHYESQFEN